MSKTSAVAAKALTSSYFELFGLESAFSLDAGRLDAAYRDIQSQVHPDRFAHGSDAERRASMQMTTHVNEAYRTLKSPVRRAKYILELNGVDVGFETNTAMPKDFLIEQMDLREQLEEAKNVDALQLLQASLAASKKALEAQIAEQIDQLGNFSAASDPVRKLMFLERFGEEIDGTYETLDS